MSSEMNAMLETATNARFFRLNLVTRSTRVFCLALMGSSASR